MNADAIDDRGGGKPRVVRTLRFDSLREMLADAERCAQPGAKSFGRRTPAENIDHLAKTLLLGVEGYGGLRVPWLVRVGAKLLKKRILSRAMKPGLKMPGGEEGAFAPSAGVSNEEAIERLRTAVDRAEREGFIDENPMLGKLTEEEWVALNLRHAELHLGMLLPPEDVGPEL